MTSKDLDAKERIITATMSLIKENKDVNLITMRNIAEKADVGIGLINYHFQTKENLINHCVQQFIGSLFGSFDATAEKFNHLQPVDKLKSLIKFIATFMMTNPELAKISTLADLTGGKEDDNSDQIMKASYPLLKEALGEIKNEKELMVIIQTMISSVQVTFLRGAVYKKFAGIDFFDKVQRDEFIDRLVDLYIP